MLLSMPNGSAFLARRLSALVAKDLLKHKVDSLYCKKSKEGEAGRSLQIRCTRQSAGMFSGVPWRCLKKNSTILLFWKSMIFSTQYSTQ